MQLVPIRSQEYLLATKLIYAKRGQYFYHVYKPNSELRIQFSILRQVKFEEAKALAEKWGCTYIECSAKFNENIGKFAFLFLA